MCSARTILGRTLARCLLAAIPCVLGLGRSPAADEVPVSDTVLWDTGRASDGGEVDLGQKKSWERVSPGTTARPLSGDVVVENERIAVIFCRGSGGPLICPRWDGLPIRPTKSALAQRNDRSRLVPVTPGGEPGTRMSEIEIRENDEEQIVLEVCSRAQGGQEMCTAYSLARGQAFLECKPIRSAAQLLGEAQKSAKEIQALYREKLPTIKNPAHADSVGRRIKQLASTSDPENLGECKTLTYELRDIAGTQHRMVGDYRVMVKRLRQEAGILGAENPSTAKMAETVRKLGGQVLREKYGVEAD